MGYIISITLLIYIEYAISSIIPHQYIKNKNIGVQNINSALNINYTTLIVSNSKALYTCNYQETYSCEKLIEIDEAKFSFNKLENNIAIITTNNVTFFDLSLKKIEASFLVNNPICSIHYLNRNNILAADFNKLIQIKIQTNALFTLTEHEREIRSLLQLSNGLLATASWDRTIKIWDPNRKYTLINTLTEHPDYVHVLIQLSNGMLVSASEDKTVKVWDPNQNFNLIKTLTGYSFGVRSLLQLNDGMLVTGSYDQIKVWDPNNEFALITTLNGHKYAIFSLLQLSNGMLVSGSYDSIKIWDPTQNYTLIYTLPGYANQLASILELSNGMLISGKDDYSIKVWDLTWNYTLIKTLTGHRNFVNTLLQLTNKMFVSGGEDGLIFVWDPSQNYTLVKTLIGHTGSVDCLLQLSNGMLVSAGTDKIIRIWDTARNFTLINTLIGHKRLIGSILQLSNEKLISGSNDGMMKVWDPYSLYSINKETEHLNKIFKIENLTDNFSSFLSLSEDRICRNKMSAEDIEILSCAKLDSNTADVLVVNQTHFLTSYSNGTISYWEVDKFYPYLSKQVSEILQNCHDCINDPYEDFYIEKFSKLNDWEIAAFLNEKITLILDLNSLQLKFLNNNSSHESPIEIIQSDANELLYAYSSGNLELYGSKLFLNKLYFEDFIAFKDYLTQEDRQTQSVIKLEKIPSCLMLFNGDKELKVNSIVNKDDRLSYKLRSQPSCENNELLKFSTLLDGVELNHYNFYIELVEPPAYKTTDIQVTKGATDIFELNPLSKDIKFLIFKGVKLGKIMFCSDCETLSEIEENKEYDSKNKFFFIVDFDKKIENNPVILMPIILKDRFGISSEVINIKLIYNIIIPWYKRWYAIVALVCAVLIGLYKVIKFFVKKKYIKVWKKVKKVGNCLGKCFCCRCRKSKSPVSDALVPNKEII